MNNDLLKEIEKKLDTLLINKQLSDKYVTVFGMNHPGDFIIKYLKQKGIKTDAVIDNNPANKGVIFENIHVTLPEDTLSVFRGNAAFLICSRYYYEMRRQLEGMGYENDVHIFKLLDMGGGNDFTPDEKNFTSEVAIALKGAELAEKILKDFSADNLLICPVKAIGDIYMACSVLKAYLIENNIVKYALVLIGQACASVADMFGVKNIYIAEQEEINCLTSAYRLLNDKLRINILQPYWNYTSFINKLDCYKGLNFCDYYEHWVFGLSEAVKLETPAFSFASTDFFQKNRLLKGKTIIFAPYANSLQGIPSEFFTVLADALKNKNYGVVTNVVGDEKPIEGTIPLSVSLNKIIPMAEYAGAYIGIRNGLSEILCSASCTKIILYPQKAYAYGTVLDLYSISHISEKPVMEIIYTGNVQKCLEKIMAVFTESDTV